MIPENCSLAGSVTTVAAMLYQQKCECGDGTQSHVTHQTSRDQVFHFSLSLSETFLHSNWTIFRASLLYFFDVWKFNDDIVVPFVFIFFFLLLFLIPSFPFWVCYIAKMSVLARVPLVEHVHFFSSLLLVSLFAILTESFMYIYI